MSRQPAFWSVVPAAGAGRRMGSEIPKQYLPLGGKTVIEHTLERLVSNQRIQGAFVAVSPGDPWWPECSYADHPRVTRVDGGSERAHSVFNALQKLALVAQENDWVLVHDAARPCLRRGDLDYLMDTLSEHSVGGILGIPLHDTVKRSDGNGQVLETLPRDKLWRAFTPQMFRLSALTQSLKSTFKQGVLVTDEASAIEWMGMMPQLVEGHADNIKITRPEDLELAAFYIGRQATGSEAESQNRSPMGRE
ncbi:MAG: 2-C-methyl-D-erythritol 4-phosphate cytidylyltransferase [Gammaproteobacteria bacterium]|nr:2-C-methyl-D-erythritol 4-phosphate cytidylyltransferase [Gammaproteobacteria bacterium]